MAGASLKWKEDKETETEGASDGIEPPLVPGVTGYGTELDNGGGKGGNSNGKKTNEATATGGSKSTTVNIQLKDLIGVLNIHGKGFKESSQQMEADTADAMLRVLAMASTS